jgi:molecular chaperone GrpE
MKKEHTENSDQEKEGLNHSENIESNVENPNTETDENQEEIDTVSTEDDMSETVEESWEAKFLEMQDRYLRLHAEFDNYRKRTNKERIEIVSTANAGILKDLIPILDDFERATTFNDTATEIESVKEGFSLIHNKYKGILESKGLKPMASKGEVFDSELHEAIANIPAESEDMKGKIIDDVEKGYTLHDKVVRFAKVVVGQ